MKVNQILIALPESTIELNGDSTLKKFSSKANRIECQGKLPGQTTSLNDALAGKMDGFQVSVPVSGLKSGDETLDDHMKTALKGKDFPEIHAAVKSYHDQGVQSDGSHLIEATVDFVIAGVKKTLPLAANVILKGDRLQVRGQKQFLMTDFGIDPPTMLFGTLRASNEVLVKYDLFLALKSNPSQKGESK